MQDYDGILIILRNNLDSKSAEVREAMNDVNNIKALIAQITGLSSPAGDPGSLPDPTSQ